MLADCQVYRCAASLAIRYILYTSTQTQLRRKTVHAVRFEEEDAVRITFLTIYPYPDGTYIGSLPLFVGLHMEIEQNIVTGSADQLDLLIAYA